MHSHCKHIFEVRWGAKLAENVGATSVTYYIDGINGDDALDGMSLSSPWKSLRRLNSVSLSPGAQVLLRRGSVWRESLVINGSGSSTQLIKIDAYGNGDNPRISGFQEGINNWTSLGGNKWSAQVPNGTSLLYVNNERWNERSSVTALTMDKDYAFSNGTVSIFSRNNPNSFTGSFRISVVSTPIQITNRTFISIKNVTVEGAGRNGIHINNAAIPDQGNILIQNVMVTKNYYSGIRIDDASNVTVDGAISAYNGRAGVWFAMNQARGSINNVVQNSKTHDNYVSSGIIFHGYGAIPAGKATPQNKIKNGKILNNVSYKNGDGAYIVYGENILVENNYFYSNVGTGSHYGVSNSGEGYGIGVGRTLNSTFTKNWFIGNQTAGIEIWGSTHPVESGPTEIYGASDGNKVIGNVIRDNEYGIQLGGPNKKNNILAYNLVSGQRKSGITQTGDLGAENPNKIFNNTVVKNGVDGIAVPDDRGLDVYNNIVAYNKGRGIRASYNGVSTNNIVFQNVLANSQVQQPRSVDPLFNNFEIDNYTIREGSPALNAGLAHTLSRDLSGADIRGMPDIGALEYGSVMVPLTPNGVSASTLPTPSQSSVIPRPTTASPRPSISAGGTSMPSSLPTPSSSGSLERVREFVLPAVEFTDSQGIYATDHIGGLDESDWVKYSGVNLDRGLVTLSAEVARPTGQSEILVRTGSPTGKVIAKITVLPTSSWDKYLYSKANILESVSGVQTLYLTFSNYATANLKSLQFGVKTNSIVPSALPTVRPPLIIEAEKYSSQIGTKLFGDYVGSLDGGDSLEYRGINFDNKYKNITLKYAAANNAYGYVQFRTGSANGVVIGEFRPVSTGGWLAFNEVRVPIDSSKGTQSLFVTFTEGWGLMNLDRFMLD